MISFRRFTNKGYCYVTIGGISYNIYRHTRMRDYHHERGQECCNCELAIEHYLLSIKHGHIVNQLCRYMAQMTRVNRHE